MKNNLRLPAVNPTVLGELDFSEPIIGLHNNPSAAVGREIRLRVEQAIILPDSGPVTSNCPCESGGQFGSGI